MESFSERYGISETMPMQIDDICERTRNRIWNRVSWMLSYYSKQGSLYGYGGFFRGLFDELGLEISNAVSFPDEVVRKLIREDSWNRVYDLIEIVLRLLQENYSRSLAESLNDVLEKDKCAYRILRVEQNRQSVYQVTRITNELEMRAVQDAAQTNFDVVNSHIISAINLFSDLERPNYAESVRSAINAVESVCCIVDGKSKTLGDAIKRLRRSGKKINERFLDGLEKLYAYTNEVVRHGTKEPVKVSQAETQFMLVVCSAITNYLLSEYGEAAASSAPEKS